MMDKLEDLEEKHKINLLAKQLTVAQFIADSLEEHEYKDDIIKYLNSGIVRCQMLEGICDTKNTQKWRSE